MSRWKRSAQQLISLGSQLQLQQTRGVKATTTKLPVVLLQDVEGLGAAGKGIKVNHGYARNYLIPKRLVEVQPKHAAGAAARAARAAAKQGSSSAGGGSSSSGGLEEELRQQKAAAAQRRQVELLIKKLTTQPLTIKRKTQGGSQTLEQEVKAKDVSDAIARQMGIEVVPELVDLEESDALRVVGEYRLPLKLILPSGDRAMLDVNVLST